MNATSLISKSLTVSIIAVVIASLSLAAPAETINLRSGDGVTPGQQDPAITVYEGQPETSMGIFDANIVAGVIGGPNAYVVNTNDKPGSWVAGLSDPAAQWISTSANGHDGTSGMYGQAFYVATTNITNATLDFHWAADDRLGDYSGESMPAGVYLANNYGSTFNYTALYDIFGGGFTAESSVPWPVDVTNAIKPGWNEFFVYDRDTAAVASGVIYSATLTVTPEPATMTLLALGGLAMLRRRK